MRRAHFVQISVTLADSLSNCPVVQLLIRNISPLCERKHSDAFSIVVSEIFVPKIIEVVIDNVGDPFLRHSMYIAGQCQVRLIHLKAMDASLTRANGPSRRNSNKHRLLYVYINKCLRTVVDRLVEKKDMELALTHALRRHDDSIATQARYTPWSRKTRHQTFVHIFAKH